jgi:hypothetical protein
MSGKKLGFILVLLVSAFAVQLYLKRVAAAGNLGYRGSWDSAVEEAEKTGKPIMLVFGGPW